MTKRLPQDYSKQELMELIHYHHTKHVEMATKLSETRDKLIVAQREISRLKRNA